MPCPYIGKKKSPVGIQYESTRTQRKSQKKEVLLIASVTQINTDAVKLTNKKSNTDTLLLYC